MQEKNGCVLSFVLGIVSRFNEGSEIPDQLPSKPVFTVHIKSTNTPTSKLLRYAKEWPWNLLWQGWLIHPQTAVDIGL